MRSKLSSAPSWLATRDLSCLVTMIFASRSKAMTLRRTRKAPSSQIRVRRG
ncbi:MAG: hypothetical protein IPK80_27450 [Nannocystis sp.]|nr:hypothetical protein [Nannocystis sp.]